MDVTKVDIWILGDRNYPIAHVKLPGFAVSDFRELVQRAQALNPAVRPDDVVRAIFRLGSYRVLQNLIRGIPVRVGDLPAPTDGRGSRSGNAHRAPMHRARRAATDESRARRRKSNPNDRVG